MSDAIITTPFREALATAAGGGEVEIVREGFAEVGELSVFEMFGILAAVSAARARAVLLITASATPSHPMSDDRERGDSLGLAKREDLSSSGAPTTQRMVRSSMPTDYVSIDEAALRLSLSPLALRARCRRAARREGRTVVAHIGAGVLAFKFGRSWRVRFPRVAA